MEFIKEYVFVFILAFTTTLAFIPFANYLAHRWGVIALPGGRRKHKGAIPSLGGLAIFLGFSVAVIVAQFLPIPRYDPKEIIRFVGLMLGALVIVVMGIIDDIFELDALPLFMGQIATSSIAIAFLIFIEQVNNPFSNQPLKWAHWFTVSVSLFWFIMMINTVNFLDGLDGLAGGVVLIAGLLLFVNSAFRIVPAQTSVSLLPLALTGCLLAFLLFNFHPARLFMGSSGAQFLGYALGALSIIGGAKMATVLLVMGLPIMDVFWQAISRLLQGRSPFEGDRGHLHFRLVDLHFPQRPIVLSYYAFCLSFGMVTVFTGSRIIKLIALLSITLIGVFTFIWLIKAQAKQVRDEKNIA